MTEDIPRQPRRLNCSAVEVLRSLIGCGRVQAGVRTGAVLHERHGVLQDVAEAGDRLRLTGAEHDSEMSVGAVHALIVEESLMAKSNRILPRLSFVGDGGQTLMTLVGLEGSEPFRAALDQFAAEDSSGAQSWPKLMTPVAVDDPGLTGLRDYIGEEIAVVMELPLARSRWTGRLEDVRSGDNFVNIIRPDFHLHLRGGAVARWEAAGKRRVAFGHDGQALGLSVERLSA